MALGSLVTATCLALAFFASAWLVPPYLAVMALILGVPSVPEGLSWARVVREVGGLARSVGRVRSWLGTTNETSDRLDPSTRPRRSRAGSGPEPDGGLDLGESAHADNSGLDRFSETDTNLDPETDPAGTSNPDSPAAKARRGRGRKAKAPAVVEPSGVTWVKVGPGKFVRADLFANAPASPVPGEPAETETETEPPTTPDPLTIAAEGHEWEPDEDRGTDLAPCQDASQAHIEDAGVGEARDNGNAPEAPTETTHDAPEIAEPAPVLVDGSTSTTSLDPAPPTDPNADGVSGSRVTGTRLVPESLGRFGVAHRLARGADVRSGFVPRVIRGVRNLSWRSEHDRERGGYPVSLGRSHRPRSPPRGRSAERG